MSGCGFTPRILGALARWRHRHRGRVSLRELIRTGPPWTG